MTRRTSFIGHSFTKNLRAFSLRMRWLSLSPKFIGFDLLVALGKTQNVMSDNVALDFGRARGDGLPARGEVSVKPQAVVDGSGRAFRQEPVGPKNLHGELIKTLRHLAEEQLLDGSFGA